MSSHSEIEQILISGVVDIGLTRRVLNRYQNNFTQVGSTNVLIDTDTQTILLVLKEPDDKAIARFLTNIKTATEYRKLLYTANSLESTTVTHLKQHSIKVIEVDRTEPTGVWNDVSQSTVTIAQKSAPSHSKDSPRLTPHSKLLIVFTLFLASIIAIGWFFTGYGVTEQPENTLDDVKDAFGDTNDVLGGNTTVENRASFDVLFTNPDSFVADDDSCSLAGNSIQLRFQIDGSDSTIELTSSKGDVVGDACVISQSVPTGSSDEVDVLFVSPDGHKSTAVTNISTTSNGVTAIWEQ